MEPNEVWNVQDALQHLLAVTECFCGKFNPPNERTCYWCRAQATWKAAEAEPTDQQALSAIERLIPAETTDRAWRKIYRISHSMVRAHSCHHAHTDWRKTILEAKDGI